MLKGTQLRSHSTSQLVLYANTKLYLVRLVLDKFDFDKLNVSYVKYLRNRTKSSGWLRYTESMISVSLVRVFRVVLFKIF